MALHSLVQEVVTSFLDTVDAEAPGLVEGLYLTGSVALDDFRPHESDIDFVAVMATHPDTASIATLERAHARLHARYRRPFFDGIYVTWDDLADRPTRAESAPYTQGGRFHPHGDGGRNPVTWHTLANHGVVRRGPTLRTVAIFADPADLAAWTLDNLNGYWRRWRERSTRPFSKAGLAALGSWSPAWGVLGVSRLHYTLATGGIISKEGAGMYALDAFPERWHRVVHECLRIRRGEDSPSLYRTPMTRRHEALAFIGMVIEDARRFDRDGGMAPIH